jgi:hypothetical protein
VGANAGSLSLAGWAVLIVGAAVLALAYLWRVKPRLD